MGVGTCVGTWVETVGTWVETVGTWVETVGTWVETVGTWVETVGTWVETASDVHAAPANNHKDATTNGKVRMRTRTLLPADFSAVYLEDTRGKSFFPRFGLIATPTFTGRPGSATIIDQGMSKWQTSGCGSAPSVL